MHFVFWMMGYSQRAAAWLDTLARLICSGDYRAPSESRLLPQSAFHLTAPTWGKPEGVYMLPVGCLFQEILLLFPFISGCGFLNSPGNPTVRSASAIPHSIPEPLS